MTSKCVQTVTIINLQKDYLHWWRCRLTSVATACRRWHWGIERTREVGCGRRRSDAEMQTQSQHETSTEEKSSVIMRMTDSRWLKSADFITRKLSNASSVSRDRVHRRRRVCCTSTPFIGLRANWWTEPPKLCYKVEKSIWLTDSCLAYPRNSRKRRKTVLTDFYWNAFTLELPSLLFASEWDKGRWRELGNNTCTDYDLTTSLGIDLLLINNEYDFQRLHFLPFQCERFLKVQDSTVPWWISFSMAASPYKPNSLSRIVKSRNLWHVKTCIHNTKRLIINARNCDIKHQVERFKSSSCLCVLLQLPLHLHSS